MNHKNQYGLFYTHKKKEKEMKAILKISADFGFFILFVWQKANKNTFCK